MSRLSDAVKSAIIVGVLGMFAAAITGGCSYDTGYHNGQQEERQSQEERASNLQATIQSQEERANNLQTTIEAERQFQEERASNLQATIEAVNNNISVNRLDIYHDFEDDDEGWNLKRIEKREGDNVISQYPDNDAFPGDMKSQLTHDVFLTGESSLRVDLTHSEPGSYKSFLFRKGVVTGNSITIYVFVPQLEGVTIEYIQLCVSEPSWGCSPGTRSVSPGEWAPVTMSLEQLDENGHPFSNQSLDELALQWLYVVEDSSVAYSIFLDAFEIRQSGP